MDAGILLYKRYMDDILVISNLTEDSFQQFISELQNTIKLKITASYNYSSVNFLDISITKFMKNSTNTQLMIHPFSKKFPIFPVPSIISKRGIHIDTNIIISQILRTWRLATNNKIFSMHINKYLELLLNDKYHRLLRKNILKFLKPIKITTHYWSCEIMLCPQCKHISYLDNINITKIMQIENKMISSKKPLNCYTKSIYLVLQNDNKFTLTFSNNLHQTINSIHNLLSFEKTIGYCKYTNYTILPIGNMTTYGLDTFIKKNSMINCDIIKENMKKGKNIFPCYIHKVFKYPTKVYGLKYQNIKYKKFKCFNSYFNIYKKFFQEECANKLDNITNGNGNREK